jgi:hypothetical protein
MTLGAMKAQRKVNRITFKKSEADPGEILYVDVPKLNKNEVIVPGSLALIFNIDLSGGHANNFLVQNVTRALVEKMVVKFGGTTLEDTDGYNVYKTFEDLFLSQERRDGMILEGIQSEDLCKIRSGAGDKKTSGVDAEEKLEEVFGKKYRIRLDHQILTANGVFYPHALTNNLTFELTLAPASHVVKGSEPTQLTYKLTKIQLQYEMITSDTLADEAERAYTAAKEFLYFHVQRPKIETFTKGTDTLINIKVDSQRRSLKAILLLFKEPFTAGARDSEKYIFPDIKKVKVTVNGKPTMLYSEGIEGIDMWEEAKRLFVKEKNKAEHMNLTKFYTGDRFGLVIDLRTMANQAMHGSGTRIVNSTEGVQLEIERSAKGSGKVNCHVFVISDSQLNIMDRQLESVTY